MKTKLTLVLFWIAIAPPVLACPLCKETARESSQSLAGGFNLSILVMLGTLFSLMAFAIFSFIRAAKN